MFLFKYYSTMRLTRLLGAWPSERTCQTHARRRSNDALYRLRFQQLFIVYLSLYVSESLCFCGWVLFHVLGWRQGFGITRVLEDGDLLEKAACSVSVIHGVLTPERAQVTYDS